jgi:methionine sulfoxide reductase heme-binding subunit
MVWNMTSNMPLARALPILLGIVAGLGAICLGFRFGYSPTNDWQLAARWTARVGFPIFLLTYSASSLFRVFPNETTRTLLRTRRQWGLGFAITHSIHLFALISFTIAAGRTPSPVTLIGGGFAYVMLYAMALTSNDWSMAKLDRNWKRLHTVGIHTLWAVFTFTYVGRIMRPESQMIDTLFTSLAVTALFLRLMGRRRMAAPIVKT